ncbi:MAG: DNA translocase FtsK 4TM domain-containing protein [Hyphomicrobium sp.]
MSLDTRGIDPQRLLPQSMEDRLLGWLARVGGITLLALVAVLWLSLLTWSYSDPSLTHATTSDAGNWMGPIGAIIADLLLQTFGFAAVIALVAPIAWTRELTRDRRVTAARTKVGFYPLAILAVAGALSAFPVPSAWPLHHGLGGVLGDGLFRLASRLFAIINEDRAVLASSLVLIAAAVSTFAKSVGFDLESVGKALLQSATAETFDDISEPAATRASHAATAAHPARNWWRFAARAKSKPVTEQLYGAAAGLAVPEQLPPPHQWTRDERFPHLQSYGAAPVAAPPGLQRALHNAPQSSFDDASFGADMHDRESPFGGFDFGTPGPRDSGAPARETAFDANTDKASRAIAARFAPGASDAPQQAQALKTAATAKAANLLGGLSFRKSDSDWKRPSLNLLKRAPTAKPGPEFTQTVMRGNARLLEDVLADFGVKGEVKDIKPGPVITLYELEPSRGTKSARVIGLADDIARSMSVVSVRAAVVPGRNAIGLELPNVRREPVLLREIFEADAYRASDFALPLALGKSIGGEPVVADLARMPHLLVAGTTGSGKSVGVNAMVLSLLYRHAPEDCRLIMIDPKMLELSVYNGIPHLLTPVVTDPHKAVAALNWAVGEMEERYKRMASLSVRNIDMFNNRVRNAKKRGEMLARTVQTGFDKAGQPKFEKQKMDLDPLPHIVIVVDEFADLMTVAGKDVEVVVQRLAQMARAAGIHLIMATQRPSVDVITGTIKANFPTRISFKVTSKIDSRTILNEQGAEQLLGQGDMLFSSGTGQIVRVHGAFVSDEEVEAVADALRRQGPTNYVDGIADVPVADDIASGERTPSEGDLYDRAVAIVLRDRKASTSYLQRRLQIGYNRAADLIERMEREGLVSAASAVGKREILAAGGGSANAA